MWVCRRHTRMRWFKSPWTPSPPAPTTFIHSKKPKKTTTTHNATGPEGGKAIGVPGLVLFRPYTGDWTHSTTVRTIWTQAVLCFFVVVFILSPLLTQRLLFFSKRPQKADFGRDPSGLERQESVRMEENWQAGNHGGETNIIWRAQDVVGLHRHKC